MSGSESEEGRNVGVDLSNRERCICRDVGVPPLCTLQADWLTWITSVRPLTCLRSCFLQSDFLACMVYVFTRVRGEQTFGMYVRNHAVLVPALYDAHKPRLLRGTVGI